MAFTYTGEMVDLGFGRGWLSRPAASSIFRIDRQLGHAMQITEAGRLWAKQNEHWQRYQRYLNGGPWAPIALSPDAPSVHQKGAAIDSDEAQRIVRILEDHGWRRTVYRWVNGVWTLVEPWHFEYFAHLDNHRNSAAGGGATDLEEDDMNRDQDAALSDVWKKMQRVVQILEAVDVRTGNKQSGNLAIAAERIASLPADVWSHELRHPLLPGASIPAGDFLRFEPAEHENTRRAVAAASTALVPDFDYEQVAAEIAERFPELDAHAFAVAAADEADRRERERLANPAR